MAISGLWADLYWTWVASEIFLQIVTRTTSRSGSIMDRGSLPLLLGTIFCSIWAALAYTAAHAYRFPGTTQRVAAASFSIMVIGLAIRWTAILTLGMSFSTNVAIHDTQRLRKTGLFRYLRHPSYTGLLLIFAAIGISQRNWVSLGIMLIFPSAALIYRIHVEEAALKAAFGEEYIAYSRSTRRLIPGIY